MEKQIKKDECCAKSCCGKKVIAAVLVGLFLFSSGYMVAKAHVCEGKICPFSAGQQK